MIWLFLISCVYLSYAEDSEIFQVREHSLTSPYPTVFSTSNSFWHLSGNCMATDRYIRLTSDIQSISGGLWNAVPVTYPDWEMHVNFKIHGNSKAKKFYGDGFAIWYTRDMLLNGPVFGYRNHFSGLAILMDTYGNQKTSHSLVYPRITAIINNGSLFYDHDRDGSDIAVASCESSFRERDTDTHVAIRYENNRLSVYTDIDGENTWKQCFSIDGVQLPTHYYFGFTATTGQLSDNHDIISIHTYQLESDEDRLKEERRYIIPAAPTATVAKILDTHVGSSIWYILKIISIIILIIIFILIVIGLLYYINEQRKYVNRLY